MNAKKQDIHSKWMVEDTCWGFYPALSCVPFPLHLLFPALIKSHIDVSQVCTEPPSKHSAWARELGPTWPEASTTSFRPFLPSLPPFLQPLSSINEALRPLPLLHHRILIAFSEPWGSLSRQKFPSCPIWATSASCRYLR